MTWHYTRFDAPASRCSSPVPRNYSWTSSTTRGSERSSQRCSRRHVRPIHFADAALTARRTTPALCCRPSVCSQARLRPPFPCSQTLDHGVPFDLDDLKIRLASGELGESYEARPSPRTPIAAALLPCCTSRPLGLGRLRSHGAAWPGAQRSVALAPTQAAILRLEKEIEDVAAGKDRLRAAARTLAAKLDMDGVRQRAPPRYLISPLEAFSFEALQAVCVSSGVCFPRMRSWTRRWRLPSQS